MWASANWRRPRLDVGADMLRTDRRSKSGEEDNICRGRCRSLVLASVALSVLLSERPAQGQIVTSAGIQCGGIAVPFDTAHGATLGANETRRRALDVIYSYGQAAF